MSDTPVEHSSGDPQALALIVVEPDILARMIIAEYLRECGYRVIEAVTADDVMAVLGAGWAIDTVLAEVQLTGGVDGFALAQWLRTNHPDIDVILTSGIDRAADKAGDICDEGPLQKPYHPQEVVRRINVLRARRGTSPQG